MVDLKPDALLEDSLAIEGGHYVIEKGKERIGEVEIFTWREAVKLYAEALKKDLKNVGVLLLIDDFGVDPKARQDFHSNYSLPTVYSSVLREYGINPNEILVSWSTQLRNRADKDIRKSRVKNIERSEGGYVARFPEGGHRTLTKRSCPVCGPIVARYFKEKSKKFASNINLYSWEWNGSNENGLRLAKLLYGLEMKVYNFYFAKPEVISELKVHV